MRAPAEFYKDPITYLKSLSRSLGPGYFKVGRTLYKYILTNEEILLYAGLITDYNPIGKDEDIRKSCIEAAIGRRIKRSCDMLTPNDLSFYEEEYSKSDRAFFSLEEKYRVYYDIQIKQFRESVRKEIEDYKKQDSNEGLSEIKLTTDSSWTTTEKDTTLSAPPVKEEPKEQKTGTFPKSYR